MSVRLSKTTSLAGKLINCFNLLKFNEDIWAVLRPWNHHIELDQSSPLTIHQQLIAHFQQLILNGQWLAGSLLPSTRDLAKSLGINRKTVAKVYEELVAQGWIYTEPKRGTFVGSVSPDKTASQPTSSTNHLIYDASIASEHAQKISTLMQKEMVKLTRRAALYMHKMHQNNADAGGLYQLRVHIAQLLIHELHLNTTPDCVLCHHHRPVLYQALINAVKTRGHYLLIDEACSEEEKLKLTQLGLHYFIIPSVSNTKRLDNATSNQATESQSQTRNLCLDTIEKYCINYPVAGLWLTANAENDKGEALFISQAIRTRLQQFNVLVIEDHTYKFIHHNQWVNQHYNQSKDTQHYTSDNTIIIGTLFAQRHPHVDIAYLALPDSLKGEALQYLENYIEPQSMLNAHIQYEFIKKGHYKKLSHAWSQLIHQRYDKLTQLSNSKSLDSELIVSKKEMSAMHQEWIRISKLTHQAIYICASSMDAKVQCRHALNALNIASQALNTGKFEFRIQYNHLEESAFHKLNAFLNTQIEVISERPFLKTG